MRVLKQSTTPTVMVLMVDATDHVTGKTGLTLTVTASKNGGAFASLDGSATVTEISAGWYKITLTANDTATIGDYAIHATATGADPTDRLLCVEAADLTDIDGEIDAIKAKTDQLVFANSAVNANAWVNLTAQNILDIVAAIPGVGTGNNIVDHNTGGTDNLRYMDRGAGIDNATITAYLRTDYLAGNTGITAVRGNATTGPDGRWLAPMFLDAGYTYIITFYKQGSYNTSTAEVTI